MKHITLFENYIRNNMEYGILYARVVFDKGHEYNWLRYCRMFNALPQDLKDELEILSNEINTKYAEDIVIKMDASIIPGCVTKADKIEEIAQEIYTKMQEIFTKLNIDNNCVRLVYGVGEMDKDIVNNEETTHMLPSWDIMVKVGTTLDKSNKAGIIKV